MCIRDRAGGIVAVVLLLVAGAAGWYFGIDRPRQAERIRKVELARIEAEARSANDGKEKARLEAEAERLRTEREKQQAADKARAEADARERERRANAKGGLLVKSVPEGATVTLGTEDAQTSPATFKGVKIGKYPLRLTREGYEQVSREVEIKENDFTDLGTINLVRETGSVRVESAPSGAVVKRGETELGTTPLDLASVPTGEANYTLAMKGYKPADVIGTVKLKEQVKLTAKLEKSYPTLEGSYENSLGMKLVPVPGTRVLFSVWDTRVKDYEAYAAAAAGGDNSWKSPGFEQGPTHPVVKVSWDDAQAYCRWLTEKERKAGLISAEQSYRLPTDAEWSMAVGLDEPSVGTPKEKDWKVKDVYPWGTQWPPPRGAGNYRESLKVDDFPNTSPVGSFSANRHGLYDMGGNAMQWCEDWYDADQKSRVLRGASWDDFNPVYLLSSCRLGRTPDLRYSDVGFRCVMVVGSSP